MKNNEHNFDEESNLPLGENGKNPFGLPADYFASFEDKLKKKLELENELSEFPLLSSLPNVNPFSAPENYFANTESKVELAAELSSYPKLQAINKPALVDLGVDYLKELQVSLSYKVELAEELKEYQLLYQLDKYNPFIVAEDYFENLPSQIKERVYATAEAKLGVLDKVLGFIFGRKLALTFGVMAIIVVSVYLYNTSHNVMNDTDCHTMACLEKQDILNEQNVQSFDDEQLMELVDVNALDKQLSSEIQQTDTLQNEEFILENTNTDQLLEELQ